MTSPTQLVTKEDRSGRSLLPGDDPDGVDDAGEVAEEGEQQADPELDLQQRSPSTDSQLTTRKLASCRRGRERKSFMSPRRRT